MRSYEEFVRLYGTQEEKKEFYGPEGQELVASIQKQRVLERLSEEQRYEIACGCASTDDYLTESDLDYWRQAGEYAAIHGFRY